MNNYSPFCRFLISVCSLIKEISNYPKMTFHGFFYQYSCLVYHYINSEHGRTKICRFVFLFQALLSLVLMIFLEVHGKKLFLEARN